VNTSSILPLRLQVAAAAVLVGLLLGVIRLIRAGRLNLRDSLVWVLSTTAALAVTLFPSILAHLAAALSIVVPANAVFALAFVYVLFNLLALTLGLSAASARTRRLIQECAMLRAELELVRGSARAAGEGAEAR
jgi:hypothetical protein